MENNKKIFNPFKKMTDRNRILNDEVSELLSELYDVSTKKGIHLDNDLETGLFMLLLDENYDEMCLLKNRIITEIKQLKNRGIGSPKV